MYRTVMVPLDGSSWSERALPLAREIARRSDAALHLVHVYAPAAPVAYMDETALINDSVDGFTRDDRQAYLHTIRDRLMDEDGVDATVTLLDQGLGAAEPHLIAQTLGKHAETIGADLIVLATGMEGAALRALFGSVAHSLAACSCVPLLVVPGQHDATLVAGMDAPRILISLDGSELAEQVIQPVTTLARTIQASCTLIQVVEPLMLRSGFFTSPVDLDPDDTRARCMYARQYLGRIAQRLRADELTVFSSVRVAERPATAILEESERIGARVIALAVPARRGIARLLRGSVADQVVRRARLPVLLYRPVERRSPTRRRYANDQPYALPWRQRAGSDTPNVV